MIEAQDQVVADREEFDFRSRSSVTDRCAHADSDHRGSLVSINIQFVLDYPTHLG